MPDCNACKQKRKEIEPVPFIVHEAEMARSQSTIKKLWILDIIIIALFVLTNAFWIHRWSQYEDTTITTEISAEQTADSDSDNYLIGGDYYGGNAEDTH